MKLNFYFITLLFSGFFLPSYAQVNMSVVASDLSSPIAVERDSGNNIWITEAGTGNNDGRVSFLAEDGTLTVFVESLPSFFDTVTMEVQGALRSIPLGEGKIAVLIGDSPDSLGESILIFDREDFAAAGSALLPEDARHAIRIGDFLLSQGFDHSNIYTFVHDGCDMYIVDAAANSIVKRDGLTGELSIFATFLRSPTLCPSALLL